METSTNHEPTATVHWTVEFDPQEVALMLARAAGAETCEKADTSLNAPAATGRARPPAAGLPIPLGRAAEIADLAFARGV